MSVFPLHYFSLLHLYQLFFQFPFQPLGHIIPVGS